VLRTGRLRLFGYMDWMVVDNWVKRCMSVTGECKAPRDRPRKTWEEVLCNELRVKGLNKEAAIR